MANIKTLTIEAIDALAPATGAPYLEADGGSLYLKVTKTGFKSFVIQYRVPGNANEVGRKVVGNGYPTKGTDKEKRAALTAARAERDLLRVNFLDRGIDPRVNDQTAKLESQNALVEQQARAEQLAADEAAKVALQVEDQQTVQAAIAGFLVWYGDQSRIGCASPQTAKQVAARLNSYVVPTLGATPVRKLDEHDVALLHDKIQEQAPRVAEDVLMNLGQVWKWARKQWKLRIVSPVELAKEQANKLSAELREKTPHAHLDLADAGALLFKLRADAFEAPWAGRTRRVRLDLVKALSLTALRPGEARVAQWTEIHWMTGMWMIPASRMKRGKAGKHFLVPMSKQLVELLREIQAANLSDTWIFPSDDGKGPCHLNTHNDLLKKLGFEGEQTGHGFRHSLSTAANAAAKKNPMVGFDWEVIEVQLDHMGKNKVRAIYNGADYMEQRAALLQWWADQLDRVHASAVALYAGSNVVPFKAAA